MVFAINKNMTHGHAKLEKKLGYSFKNKMLLKTALTHPLCKVGNDFESLEWVGDRVLNLCIAQMLNEMFPEATPNELNETYKALVNNEFLTKQAEKWGIKNFIIKTKDGVDYPISKKDMADVVEAISGALLKDSGYEQAKRFVIDIFGKNIIRIQKDFRWVNPVAYLNQYCKEKIIPQVTYSFNTSASAYEPPVTATAEIKGVDSKPLKAKATGHNNKEAKVRSARMIVLKIKNHTNI